MKHHFLLFRHCMRSATSHVDLGSHDFPHDASEYVADSMPEWGVPLGWCTPTAIDLVQKQGARLVEMGIITPGARVELVTDDYERNMATTLALSLGIDHGIHKRKGNVTGLDVIHRDNDVFDTYATDTCDFVRGDTDAMVEERLKTLPRPDIGLQHALGLLEKVAGRGNVGSLKQSIPTDTYFDYDDWNLVGAPSLLYTIGRLLFYSRAGLHAQLFAPDATVKDVFSLLQYVHWYRSVTRVSNNWSGLLGGAWAKMILLVLANGSLYGSSSLSPPLSDRAADRVTIAIAHETQLDGLSTALGATWNPPEYYTHAEFVATPPGSGLHFVRDMETGKIEISFLYPVFHKQGLEYWETDKSGTLKSTAVLWDPSPTSQSFTSSGKAGMVPSLESLEKHFLATLSKYEGAVACYDTVAARFASDSPHSQNSNVIIKGQILALYERVSSVMMPLVVSILLLGYVSRRAFFWHCAKKQVGHQNNNRLSESSETESSESEEDSVLLKPADLGEYA